MTRRLVVIRRLTFSIIVLGASLCEAETPYSILWDSKFSGPAQALIVSNQTTVQIPDFCNESAMSQFPDYPSLFVGRVMQGQKKFNLDGKTCSGGDNMTLQLYRMDWTTMRMTRGKILLDVEHHNATFRRYGQDITITNAYDPAITKYKGEHWIAFECALSTIVKKDHLAFPWANICLGPLGQENKLRLDRTKVIVKAHTPPPSDSGTRHMWFSASVPKFLQMNGHLYLYWTTVAAMDGHRDEFLFLDAKGVELEFKDNNLWPKNYGMDYIQSNEGKTVWFRDEQDPRSNGVVDISHVATDGKHIFTVAAVGGNGKCPMIGPQILPDCYRLALARSRDPFALNRERIPNDQLPGNANNYTRLIHDPSGNLYILGAFFVPHVQTTNWVSSPPPVKTDPQTGNVSYVEYPEAVSPPLLIFPVPARPRLSPAATVPLMTFLQ